MSPETLGKTYVTIEKLIECVQECYSQRDVDNIRQAYAFAENHYARIDHPAGIAYIQYLLNVATYLAELGSEPSVVSAIMVFPPPYLQETVFNELRKNFKGESELLELVEETLYLGRLEWSVWLSAQEQNESQERKEILQKMYLLAFDDIKSDGQLQASRASFHFQKKGKQLENLIRMFLAEAPDIRALIIKLVDRLYFIKLLKDLTESQQQSMNYKLLAKITLAIYAPLANRLGMWRLKSELEDMSFRLLEPDKYKEIVRYLSAKKQEREEYIAHIIPSIQKKLEGFGIEAKIFGRAKHVYSIYKKMEAKQLPFNEINDLLGIRIIVDTSEDCYNAQGILHEMYPPLTDVYEGKAGRDWIANPKENLYQSLHTTVFIEGKAVEVQIRTSAMHKIAEYGVTALQDAVHWRYKESKTYRKAKTPREASEKLRSKQLAELRKILNCNRAAVSSEMEEEQEAIISMLKGLLEDRIFAITPEGHVIDLCAGATPLDFAYRIHTELGHRYTGAKVDNHIVRLDYELKSGEIVELITSRARKGPSPEWLSVYRDVDGKSSYIFAHTPLARRKIRNWLNKYDEEFKAKHNETQKPK